MTRDEARAMAALIEADKAYDDALSRHYHAIHYGPQDEGQYLASRSLALREAAVRRAAALVRVAVHYREVCDE